MKRIAPALYHCAIALFALLFLTSCGSASREHALCLPQDALSAYCGIQSPEDLEWLPDGSGLLISENGHLGEGEGRISLLEPETGKYTVLYDTDEPGTPATGQYWGEIDCEEPDYFAPHGFHLSQRPTGRWQLLVVNHGIPNARKPDDSIEIFELKNIDDHWYLVWRGCVNVEEGRLLNDIAAAGTGFYTTQMAQASTIQASLLDYYFKRKTSVVLKWTFADGWKEVEGTRGTLLNGIQWDTKRRELLVSEWGRDRVNVYDHKGRLKRQIATDKPDNISYDPVRDIYLVAGQSASFLKVGLCLLDVQDACDAAYSVYRLEPPGYRDASVPLYVSDGDYYGGATTAIPDESALYIGSFAGDRLLRVDLAQAQIPLAAASDSPL